MLPLLFQDGGGAHHRRRRHHRPAGARRRRLDGAQHQPVQARARAGARRLGPRRLARARAGAALRGRRARPVGGADRGEPRQPQQRAPAARRREARLARRHPLAQPQRLRRLGLLRARLLLRRQSRTRSRCSSPTAVAAARGRSPTAASSACSSSTGAPTACWRARAGGRPLDGDGARRRASSGSAVGSAALALASGLPDPSGRVGRALRLHPGAAVAGVFDEIDRRLERHPAELGVHREARASTTRPATTIAPGSSPPSRTRSAWPRAARLRRGAHAADAALSAHRGARGHAARSLRGHGERVDGGRPVVKLRARRRRSARAPPRHARLRRAPVRRRRAPGDRAVRRAARADVAARARSRSSRTATARSIRCSPRCTRWARSRSAASSTSAGAGAASTASGSPTAACSRRASADRRSSASTPPAHKVAGHLVESLAMKRALLAVAARALDGCAGAARRVPPYVPSSRRRSPRSSPSRRRSSTTTPRSCSAALPLPDGTPSLVRALPRQDRGAPVSRAARSASSSSPAAPRTRPTSRPTSWATLAVQRGVPRGRRAARGARAHHLAERALLARTSCARGRADGAGHLDGRSPAARAPHRPLLGPRRRAHRLLRLRSRSAADSDEEWLPKSKSPTASPTERVGRRRSRARASACR